MAEIDVIPKLRRKNIIKLIGFCAQGEECILVYEYILISDKTDVYGFGIVLLEIISGKLCVSNMKGTSRRTIFPDFVSVPKIYAVEYITAPLFRSML